MTFTEMLASMSPDQLRESIAGKEEQIRSLEQRYGTGVRPAWVGEEIGILLAHKGWYQAELDKR